MKKILVVGASSLIAEHCMRLWVREPVELTLIGRSREHLERIAADLRTRSPASVLHVRTTDFLAEEAIVKTLAEAGEMDIALVAHGSLPDQSRCQSDPASLRAALDINAISPALFVEAIAAQLARQGYGTLGVIGSVAGDRGRKSNYVYGAAKGLLARYVEGLQHRFAGTAIRIVCIRPGPTDTPMTAHLREGKLRLADPAAVARDIVRGIDHGCRVIYTPGRWRWVMGVLRHLPAAIFNRLDI